jgi:hypothetical protein
VIIQVAWDNTEKRKKIRKGGNVKNVNLALRKKKKNKKM